MANVFNSKNQMAASSDDSAGNLLLVSGFTLASDAENRQVSATEQPNLGSLQEIYLYDGNGQRVEKIAPAGNTIYVFDAFGQLTAEYNTFSSSPACTTCYLSTDRLGSVRMVTDQSGTLVTQHDYLPFGEDITASPASNDVEQRFTGQIRDTETGMDYFSARYFTAALGRFNSADPRNAGARLEDPQSWNAYAYVRNSPLALTDISGLDPGQGPTTVLTTPPITVTATPDPVVTGDPGTLGTVASGGTTNRGSVNTVSYFPGQAPQPVYVPFLGTMTSANIIFHPPQAGDFDPSANNDALENYAQALALVGQNIDAQKAFITKFAFASAGLATGGAAFTTLTGITGVSGLTTLASGGEALGTAGLETGQVTLVSRWGAQALNAGNWVMRGGSGVIGYVLSGKWQPGFGNQFASFTSGQNYLVPSSAIQNPGWAEYGLGWIKGLLGQAIYRP